MFTSRRTVFKSAAALCSLEYSPSGSFTPARSARYFTASMKVKFSYSIIKVNTFPPAPHPKQ